MLRPVISCPHNSTSCGIILMPYRFRASRGERSRTSSPSMRISPEFIGKAPTISFKSVDFPDPFSPTTACISPWSTSKLTRSRAFTPGNVLVTFSILTAGIRRSATGEFSNSILSDHQARERSAACRSFLSRDLKPFLDKLQRHRSLVGWHVFCGVPRQRDANQGGYVFDRH